MAARAADDGTGVAGRGSGGDVDRIALFSDVHGNLPALKAVVADVEAAGIARVYCLGDLVGYGTDPNGVIDLMRACGIPSLLGNYDEGVGWETGDCGCFYSNEVAAAIGRASYDFTVAAVTADRKAYLRGLPREMRIEFADKRVHLVHGSPRRINEYLLRDRDERTFLRLAAMEADDVLAFGHTHDPWFRRYGGTLFVNVGSVGKPKDGDARAGYVVLHALPGVDVEVEIRRVAYDLESTVETLIEVGLPPRLGDALRRGV